MAGCHRILQARRGRNNQQALRGMISRGLQARSVPAQQTKVKIGCTVLNRMRACAALSPFAAQKAARSPRHQRSHCAVCRFRAPTPLPMAFPKMGTIIFEAFSATDG